MVQLKFTAPLIAVNSNGSKGVVVPKAVADLLVLKERYVFIITETEQGFQV